ncbi:hypothetical protein ACEN2I_16480 [Flavobacterium sp. W22_SRS_FK3]|uniref:hypothetical protein n=1 Tax=Flavobacterium sp. W22_SRS_FK3 TaxID=3240275 RepID=UPI003F929141
MEKIPENYIDFLYWVKERTESFWSKDPETSLEDFVCDDWMYGAKWIGLTDEEISNIERKYVIEFTPEHKDFLRILHTIDRYEKIEYTETFDENAEILVEEIPYFYNWQKDDKEITERLIWPYKTILEDVLGVNQVWLKSWGEKPISDIEKEKIFSDWFQKTPKLIPIKSHRFIISDENLKFRPVLSVYGSDIIVYGWNLRSYILNELKDELGLIELVYDEEDKEWYPETKKELREILEKDYKFNEEKDIPYWKEMILIWNSGWSSFGLKWPGDGDSFIQPIVKTFAPENEEIKQKRFNEY